MSIKKIKVRHIIADIPVIGRHIYPFKHKNSIFHAQGSFYSYANCKDRKLVGNKKIAVIGLPKSGNTWLSSLFATCFDKPVLNFKFDVSKSGVTMLHHPFSKKVYMRKDLIAAAYIIRDVRDVIVSFYHYAKTDDYKKFVDPTANYQDWEDFYFNYFLSKMVYAYDWFTHTEEYVKHGIPVIKYENMWDNPQRELEILFHKMGVEIDSNKIAEAIEKNTLSKKKESGANNFWKKFPSTHFRKGGYGGYKEELPEKVLNDINIRFKPLLERWGYTI